MHRPEVSPNISHVVGRIQTKQSFSDSAVIHFQTIHVFFYRNIA